MVNQTKDSIRIVNNWDLNQVQRDEKLEILNMWETKLGKDDFKTILEICSNFIYYSEGVTSLAYKDIFNKNNSETPFFEQSLFLPLRRKERIESSVDMFSIFRLANRIDANKTHVNGAVDYLEKYKASKEFNSKAIKEFDQEVVKGEVSIHGLQTKLEAYRANRKIRSSIEKQISKLQAIKARKKERIDKSIKEFHQNYYSIKNLIIIDDFIGTGDSVVQFLKKLDKTIRESKITINLFLWVIEASESGMEAIEDTVKELEIEIHISFYKKTIDVLAGDIIFSRDNIEEVKALIEKVNKQNRLKPSPYCKNHAIASFVNAPNNNLTLLSEESPTWKALFLRTKRNKVEREVSIKDMRDTYQYLRE
ncbi:hypothetical protein HF638_24680 [Paenibacillus sp. SZ31]|uniref:phosphoribosyltransferase-like protein n=1 Tax=Paenibacillus sp. SZ31 TaxID=2725555 RepID=UPI00146C8398|nr:hypothetical protein [Paenibacillus sp. SZ31]NMI07192.1 hypothetical protein [Paenibacillus sp. SZ31]